MQVRQRDGELAVLMGMAAPQPQHHHTRTVSAAPSQQLPARMSSFLEPSSTTVPTEGSASTALADAGVSVSLVSSPTKLGESGSLDSSPSKLAGEAILAPHSDCGSVMDAVMHLFGSICLSFWMPSCERMVHPAQPSGQVQSLCMPRNVIAGYLDICLLRGADTLQVRRAAGSSNLKPSWAGMHGLGSCAEPRSS